MMEKRKEPEVDQKTALQYRDKFEQFEGDQSEFQSLWNEFKNCNEMNQSVTVVISAYNASIRMDATESSDIKSIENLRKEIKDELKKELEKKLKNVQDFDGFEKVWKEIKNCIVNDNKELIKLNKIKNAFKRIRSCEGDTRRLISLAEEIALSYKNEKLDQDPIFSMNPKIVIRGIKASDNRGISESKLPLDSGIIDQIIESRIRDNSDVARWVWELLLTKSISLDEKSEEKENRNKLISKYIERLQKDDDMREAFVGYMFEEGGIYGKHKELLECKYKKKKELEEQRDKASVMLNELNHKNSKINELSQENESIKRNNEELIFRESKMKSKLDEICRDTQRIENENDALKRENENALLKIDQLEKLFYNEKEKSSSMLSDLNVALARVSELETKLTKETGGKALARMVKLTHNTLNDLSYYAAVLRDSEEDNESMIAEIIMTLLSDLSKAGIKNIGFPKELVDYDSTIHTFEENYSIQEKDKVEIIVPGWRLTESDEILFKAKTKRGVKIDE